MINVVPRRSSSQIASVVIDTL